MKSVKQVLTSSRFVWFAFGFLCAVFLVFSTGAAEDPSVPPVGTYHIETTAGQDVYLLDTRTGHLWIRSVMFYHDLGTPEEPIYKSTKLDR